MSHVFRHGRATYRLGNKTNFKLLSYTGEHWTIHSSAGGTILLRTGKDNATTPAEITSTWEVWDPSRLGLPGDFVVDAIPGLDIKCNGGPHELAYLITHKLITDFQANLIFKKCSCALQIRTQGAQPHPR